jgi:hypothetical protein
MRLSTLALAGLLALPSACAPTNGAPPGEQASAPKPRTCFNVQQVDNFRRGRPDQVFIRVRPHDVYELQSAAGCNDVDFAARLAIVPDMAGMAGSRICSEDWVRLVVPGTAAPVSVCRARVSRQLTPEEVAALPAAHRP